MPGYMPMHCIITGYSNYSSYSIILKAIAIGLLLTGCGVAANRKPIPAGTPTANMHFGPVRAGFKSQAIHVNDGEFCHPAEFARYHAIGSYLGSDLDVEVPANQTLFVSLADSENSGCYAGLCTTACSSGASFTLTPGGRYAVRLAYSGKACTVEVHAIKNGVEEPVTTRPELQRCLY